MSQTQESPSNVWDILEIGSAIDPSASAIVAAVHREKQGAPVSYGALRHTVRMLAASIEHYGIQPGERIALMELNTPTFLLWTFACAGAGAVLVPINYRLAAPELAAVLADSGATLFVAAAQFAETAGRAVELAGTEVKLSIHGFDAENVPEGALRSPLGLPLSPSREPSFEPSPVGPDDVAHLYYTSGTTGEPKGVPLTHRNVVEHALAAATELDFASDDVWGHIAPMFHLADAWATLATTLVGAGHAFLAQFEAKTALELCDLAGVTITNLVPTMLQRMLAEAPSAGFDGGSLRTVMSGGAPIAPATVAAVLDAFQCEYVQTYGLTETSPYLTLSVLAPHHRLLSPELQLARRARTGRAFETIELMVITDDGDPVANDDCAVGEVVARGSTITPGYWNRPEETAAAFKDGWFHTGDLATIDAEGWINIVDRKKDMILTGGENVYSIEVENALYSHPAVLECAAYGAVSIEWGEEVCAAIVTRDGVVRGDELIDALRAHCGERLARYKIPRRFELLDELPKTGSGKIRKESLR